MENDLCFSSHHINDKCVDIERLCQRKYFEKLHEIRKAQLNQFTGRCSEFLAMSLVQKQLLQNNTGAIKKLQSIVYAPSLNTSPVKAANRGPTSQIAHWFCTT